MARTYRAPLQHSLTKPAEPGENANWWDRDKAGANLNSQLGVGQGEDCE